MASSSGPSRRAFLRLAGGAAAVGVLTACGTPAATPTAAPAATTAPKPTTAPAAIAPAPKPTAAAEATASTSGALNAPKLAPPLVDPASVKIDGTFKVVQQQDWNPIHNKYLQELVQNIAKQYNWPLDISYEAGFTGGSPFNQKMQAAVQTGTGPDLMWGAYNTFTLWYLKILQPVDDMVEWATKSFGQPSPGFVPNHKIHGNWYGVPFFTRTGGWWARKSVYAAGGIDVFKLKDFDQWKEASLQISDPKKKMWAYGPFPSRSGDGEYNVSTYWFETGNRLTDESGKKATFNTDLSIEAFEWMKDLYTNPKWERMLSPGMMGWNDMSDNYAFFAGTIAFDSNAGTIPAQALKQFPEVAKDTFLVPQPAMPIGKKQTLVNPADGAVFYIPQGSKNPDAAKALIQLMMSPEQQAKLWDYTQTYVTPAYAWGWDTDPVKNCLNNIDLIFKDYAFAPDTFSWYQPAPEPLLWVRAVSDAVVFTDTFGAIYNGTPVKDAVADAQKKIEVIGNQFNWE